MILDSSAVVAIFLQEPGFEKLVAKLEAAELVAIGVPSLVEVGIVLLARLGFNPTAQLAAFLMEYGVQRVPFTEAHWREALDAYHRFGRGRHPARLNFGDCLSYASARVAGQPLLCVGEDLPQTDLALA